MFKLIFNSFKSILLFIQNRIVTLFFTITKPTPKYSTTVSDDLVVKQIPKKEPAVIEAFYYLAVEPNSIFELIQESQGKMTLTQLSTGKTITIRKDLFSLNFRPVRNLDNTLLETILNKSKIVSK